MNRIGNSREDLSFAVVVRFRPDADAQRVMRRIDHLPNTGRFGQPGVAPTTTPLEIQRFDEVNRMPVVLATFLAVLGAVAVGHLLVTSVRRRRRDFAILKSLGAGRRQLLGVVAWQATIVAGFGVAVGVVAGIACGTALWYGAASSVGVGTGVTVPVAAIAVVAVTAVFIANAVAVVPARSAANTPAAVVLRAE
jgi:predicted lysophospholipase L1 biosynthesis ABC-type transport system permease subunit